MLLVKKLLSSLFSRLVQQGELSVVWPDRTTSRFHGTDQPRASVHFKTWTSVRRIALNPEMAFGEDYMDGHLEPLNGTVYDLLDLFILNMHGGVDHPVWRLHAALGRWTKRLRQFNDAARARAHVAHHYNLNWQLYSRFLDTDLQYSCAYFPRGTETLEEAQLAKKRLIAAKLHLNRPDLTVLDIGCGWGGMALTLAADYGARVTGITLSEEQLKLARARADALGLSDRVRFELADYRSITERFDRVVSVGMMEHVGIGNYPAYFKVVRDCLHDDGVALIHHIGRTDGPGATSPWLDKYIFPGGYSPALSEVVPAIEHSGLIITDLETLRNHYARTLRLWRERFAAHRDDIQDLYDERFCRMFEFYLAAAELAFRRDREVVFQIQLSPGLETLPASRDYIVEAQRTDRVLTAVRGA